MQKKQLIETFPSQSPGSQTILSKESWQVGQLHYDLTYDIHHFEGLVQHPDSDRALSLLEGKAVLVTFAQQQGVDFDFLPLKRGTSYNIPKNRPYQILMIKGTNVLVVEQSNNRPQAYQDYPLNREQLKTIRQEIKPFFN